MGHVIDTDNYMVTKDLTAILALSPLHKEETVCIRCGKCIAGCPVNIQPMMIKTALANKPRLEKLTPDKCMKCGNCSYICPARIDLKSIVQDGAMRIKEDDDEIN